MADYTVTFARSARKELENLPAQFADRILQRIESLAENPGHPVLLNSKEIKTSGDCASATIALFTRLMILRRLLTFPLFVIGVKFTGIFDAGPIVGE